MINKLSGSLAGINGTHLYLKNGDIEWDVLISATTASKVSAMEDKITLYLRLSLSPGRPVRFIRFCI